MKNLKSLVAIFLSILTLFHSCAAYQGDYSLKGAAEKGKRVKLKIKYNESLLYHGNRYEYNRIDDHHAWTISWDTDSSVKLSEIQDSTSSVLPKIILMRSSYFGFKDYEDRNSWVKINPSEIEEFPLTENLHFKKIIQQEGNYWGIVSDDYPDLSMTNLVPIHENQVDKVLVENPTMTVVGTILMVPVALGILLFLPIEPIGCSIL